MIDKNEDASTDKWFGNWMTDMIVNEVIKVINERKDSCYDVNTSKLQSTSSANGIDEIVESVVLEGGIREKTKNTASEVTDQCQSDMCYGSLVDLEVCINSSSVSNSSKQGEGDYQPDILRETTALYQLRQAQCSFNNQNGTSTSSLVTEHSDEIIQNLQQNIEGLSFENIQLSDSEAEDDAPHSIWCETSHDNEFHKSCSNSLGNDQDDACECDQDTAENNNTNQRLRHSRKFCQVSSNQYTPSVSELPPDYFEMVDQSYKHYMLGTEEEREEQELLSISSQELLIVNGNDQNLHSDEELSDANKFYHHNKEPLTEAIQLDCYQTETDENENENTKEAIKIAADVDIAKDGLNWEEEVEVQLNVTEPVQINQAECEILGAKLESNKSAKEGDFIKSRTYCSNVGLITENYVSRDYLGPITDAGLESIKGVRRVETKYLSLKCNEGKDLLDIDHQAKLEAVRSKHSESPHLNNDSINYLSFADKSKAENKKSLVSRISGAISNVFRQKRKNKSTKAQV